MKQILALVTAIIFSSFAAHASIPTLEKEIETTDKGTTTKFSRGGNLVLKRYEASRVQTVIHQILWKDKAVYRLMKNPIGRGGIDRQFEPQGLEIKVHEWDLTGNGMPDYIVLYVDRKPVDTLVEMFWVSDSYELTPVKSERIFSPDGTMKDEGEVYLAVREQPDLLKE